MLHIGLTGGIGAGKSTVAAELARLGAVVVDADAVAREVVAPGTEGLAAVVAEFGPDVLAGDGSLDRAVLARRVFGDQRALRRLEEIVHPRVRAATVARITALPEGTVVVQDVPLIVEKGLAPEYHLVLVVGAPEHVRLERLVRDRGMSRDDAAARIAAQADDPARRAVADVWLDNDGTRDDVLRAVREVWAERIAPYAENLARRRPAERGAPALVEPPRGPATWSVQAERLLARLRRAGGELVVTADHVGSTAVPGLPAKDVLDLQLGVRSPHDADALAEALADAGFPRRPGEWVGAPEPPGADGGAWAERLHANADPGRMVDLHVRVAGGPGWRFALAFRDWLRADAVARAEYLAVTRAAGEDGAGYAEAKDPWFTAARSRLEAWVEASGWRPPS